MRFPPRSCRHFTSAPALLPHACTRSPALPRPTLSTLLLISPHRAASCRVGRRPAAVSLFRPGRPPLHRARQSALALR